MVPEKKSGNRNENSHLVAEKTWQNERNQEAVIKIQFVP